LYEEEWEEWYELVRSDGLTYGGGRQERAWLAQSLGAFYVDRWFTDILYRVKGGKEATVYCCRAHPNTGRELVAAKVFRPRIFRAMKNDSLYKAHRGVRNVAGKQVLDRRSLTALKKKTAYGRRLDTTSWCQHEVRMLRELHQAGADVPCPLADAPNAILMAFVGDVHGAAPILHGLHLGPNEAAALFERLIDNVGLFLSRYVVHADLSAFNVLLWQGAPSIIDMPQAVDALDHPEAAALFERDVDHLCKYFQKQGVLLDPIDIAHTLWQRWIG